MNCQRCKEEVDVLVPVLVESSSKLFTKVEHHCWECYVLIKAARILFARR